MTLWLLFPEPPMPQSWSRVRSLSGWVSKQSTACCYLDIAGSFLLNNSHESKTHGLAPTNQEPQDGEVSFERHQPVHSPWELATMLSTHTIPRHGGARSGVTDGQVFFPALPTVNVCAESLIRTVGDRGFPAQLRSRAIRICQLAHSRSHCLALGLADALTQGISLLSQRCPCRAWFWTPAHAK